ncbi:MAG: methionyl-tRNA formyltransferase [Gemmatimonadota bacterium]|nr:methionyl-tRNA formyltransferase [Gemmatimonadota bacterium]
MAEEPDGQVRVLFWGTPGFALPALSAVTEAGHEVVGVVTRPDRPRGRGRRARPSPVRRLAGERGFPVLAPEAPHGEAFEAAIRALAPDISVVVAYGCILRRRILDVPPRGSLNLHASLLPALRGAAPVNWAIARGHAETGVTVMRMVEAMDAGPVLAQEAVAIGPRDTAAGLSRELAGLGGRLMVETLGRMEAGPVEESEQDHAAATFAPKVDREAARVEWGRGAREVGGLIRGMDDVPGAWTLLRGAPVKVFAPGFVEEKGGVDGGWGVTEAVDAGSGRPGEIVTADPKRGILVATGSGLLHIGEVQPPGRRRMESAAWVRGAGPRAGDRFE